MPFQLRSATKVLGTRLSLGGIFIGTHDGLKNHVFPRVYTPYLVLITMLTFLRNSCNYIWTIVVVIYHILYVAQGIAFVVARALYFHGVFLIGGKYPEMLDVLQRGVTLCWCFILKAGAATAASKHARYAVFCLIFSVSSVAKFLGGDKI